MSPLCFLRFFFFNDTATTEIYTLSLHDALPIPLRGAWTGNRGILHSGEEIVRFHASDLLITCSLEFRGRWHEQWQPHHYTFLYFHDEAVSFAAGHRPCAECRRESYNAYHGDLMGVAPTGKQVTVSGLTLSRLANGKVVEEYTNWDTFGMMQQLGVVPELAHA